MWRRRLSSLVLLGLILTAGRSFGQSNHSGLVSPVDAARVGLQRAWYTQIEVDRAKGKLAYMSEYVSRTKATTIYEIVHDSGRIDVSEKHLDPFGLPLGKEGAKRVADEKLAELKDLGLNPKVQAYSVPEITLYVATDRGVVHALDGETGRTRWALPVGKMNHPTMEVGASDRYVAVVNGSILYVLSASDGKLIWQRQLKGAPGAGPAITSDLIHVPMINGMMESYWIGEPKKHPILFKSHGRAMIQPTATDKSVLWPTDRGHLYVGHGDKAGVRYRLEANGTISSRATYKAPNLVFVTSVDGYLYCIQELSGDVLWRFSAGEPLSQQPVVVDDGVFVVSDHGNLFRASIVNGTEKWSTPGIKGFLAASKDRLYCTGALGHVVVIDMKSGARLASFGAVDLDMKFQNVQTDRIFIGSQTGLIQCLHEPGLRFPIVHAGQMEEEKQKSQVVQKGLKEGEEGGAAGETEPGAEVDPFGAGPGKEPPAKEADPFGAGDKPKAKPAAEEKDPFGV